MLDLLDDLAILEIDANAATAYAGKLFVDLGATVTQIGMSQSTLAAEDEHYRWIFTDRGKRRLALSWDDAAGREAIASLVAKSDVVILGHVPPELRDAAILDSEGSPVNRRAIIAMVTDFGDTGPYAAFRGTPMLVHAAGGYMYLNGDPDKPPLQGLPHHPYFQAGTALFIAAMAALLERERSGKGQIVRTSVMQTLGTLHEWTTLRYTNTGQIMGRAGNRYPVLYPYAIFEALDGYFSIGVHDLKRSDLLLAIAGHPEAIGDPRFVSGIDRSLNQAAYDALLTPWFKSTPRSELMQAFEEIRLPTAPVLSLPELLADEHLAARDFWETEYERSTPLKRPGPAAKVWKRPAGVPGDVQARFPYVGSAREAAGPLAGLRVIDATTGWAGPHGTRLLGDLGADVIRIEPPWDRGTVPPDDVYVRETGFYRDNAVPETWWRASSLTNALSFNKRCLTLRMNTPQGRAVVGRLVATADVFVDNFSTQAYESLGLDYEWLSSINPGLVTMTMPGYGRWGPAKHRVSFGPQIEAYCGAVSLMGYEDGPPHMFPFAWPDTCAGTHAGAYVLAGLWARRRTGLGQCFELSQAEAAISFIGPEIMQFSASGVVPRRTGNTDARHAPHGPYPCAGDDRWVAIAVTSDEEWQGLCRAIGRGDLATSAAYSAARGRHERRADLDAIVSAWTVQQDARAAMEALQAHGVPAFLCLDARDLVEDPYLASVDAYPEVGEQVLMGAPFELLRTPTAVRRMPPDIGEHNREILAEAGFTDAEVDALEISGVLLDRPSL